MNNFASGLHSNVNVWDLIPVLLLMLLGVSIATGTLIILLVMQWRARQLADKSVTLTDTFPPASAPVHTAFLQRPTAWLAIRSRNLQAVQQALGLHNAKPCTWVEGLSAEQKLFIAPPIKGWILIVGSGLPEPSDDVDVCFRFLLDLSRKLGHVQFFNANPVLGHHAWVRAEGGHIARAYAWVGKTVWTQGLKTRAERELGLNCFDYFEALEQTLFASSDLISINVEKVPLLAARWSLNPTTIDERLFEHAFGIAGEL